MRIGIGMGLAPAMVGGDLPPPVAGPTLALVLTPASPAAGDLVTLQGLVSGTPLPTGFASLSVTIAGTAVTLAGTGLQRTFVARGGALSVSASVTTVEGTASTTLSASIPAGLSVASVAGFGSSTMEGDAATTTAARALNLAAAALGAGTIRNQGLGGTVLQNSPDASGAPRANNGRDRFVGALLGANQSGRLFILYGANDLRYTGAPATFNLAGFSNDLREVLNGLLTGGYARDQIVLASPNWYPDATYSVGSTGFTGSNRTIHEAHVNACSQIAAEYGVAYADVYGRMRDLGGPALMSADGLHANDAGHQVIAHAFLTAAVQNPRAAVVPGAAASPVAESLSLDWAAVPGATGYEVEAGVAGSHAFALSATPATPGHVFTGLAPGSYLARVRAIFADGPGPWAFWTVPVAVAGVGVPGRVVTGDVVFAGQVAGTLLADVPAVSGVWARHVLSTGQAAITADGTALRGPGSTSQFIVATLDDEPLETGVFVEMDFLIRSNSAQLTTYAVARASASSLTFLAAGYNGSAWRILKYVNGAVTVLGSYAQTEAIGSTPQMRFEVGPGEQRIYRNDVLVLTANEPDTGLGALGEGLGLRLGAGSTAWTSTNGGQLTGVRVGRLP
jgi:lysophospholipase L1-like esterase